MDKINLGLIGIGVMGQNLTLNIERNGFSVAVYDREIDRIKTFLQGKAKGKRIIGSTSIDEFLKQLERPRRIILLVNAGKPVDDVIESMKQNLENGDLIIDGGNSYFMDTERRCAALEEEGIYFIGSGVSGGEEGALKGPSIMPGGAPDAYNLIKPVFTKIAAHINDEPCCAYIGPRGAGHYVKMIHNGIEYAIMQLICEAYDIIKTIFGHSASEIGYIFKEWNTGDLNSYLFEISHKVLLKVDEDKNEPLVDLILDTAEQKGTGIWTSQNAFDVGIPIPTINAAVESRILSSFKEQRKAAANLLKGPVIGKMKDGTSFLNDVRSALYASIIISYAQGMALLGAASKEYKYDLKLDKIAKIWRGGCIIRSKILDPIHNAYQKSPSLENMMTDNYFSTQLNILNIPLRRTVATAVKAGIPIMAMSASLAYYDAYRSNRLPANLLQAQRDYFGAHTYRRIDKEGVFHTIWEE
jgi:6-phosphogluconate dehydrogenase